MENNVNKPRIHVLLWVACMGGLVALGCRELEEILVATFPENRKLVHAGMMVLFGLSLLQVSIKPFFEEIGRKLK